MLAQGFLCVIHSKSRIFSLSISSHSFRRWNNTVFSPSTFHHAFHIWTHRYSQSFIRDKTFVFILPQTLNTESLDHFPKKYLDTCCITTMVCEVLWHEETLLQRKSCDRKRDSFLRQVIVIFRGLEMINSPSLRHKISVGKTLKGHDSKTRFHIFPHLKLGCHLYKSNNSLLWNSVKYELATGDSHFLIKCQLKSIKKL